MNQKRSKQAFELAIKHYWQQMVANKWTAFPGLFLTGVGSILVFYLPPLVIGRLLGRFQSGTISNLDQVTPYIAAFAGVWLSGELLFRFAIFLAIKAESRGFYNLYNQAMQLMLQKDLSFFHDNFAGSLTKKTNGYAGRYIEVFDTLLFNVFPNILPLGFVSYILWKFSPWLVVGLVGLVALTVIIIIPFIKRRRKLVAVREAATNQVSGHVADVYANIDAVRAFGREDFELKNHNTKVLDLKKKLSRSWEYQNERIDIIVSPLYVLTNVFGLVLALHLASKIGASAEIVFVTFTYYSGITRFMWEFNGIYRRLESALSDAAEFTELLLDKPTLLDPEHPENFETSKGLIEFKDVTFRYQDNKKRELFTNLNMTIQPGEKIGLVGHSGGGKTTITKLLLRFMDIQSGSIEIDGQNISKVKQSELRQHIAYVPQEPYMFHRSITDNIRYGKLEATEEEIHESARLSHSLEFIEQLSEGFKTLIGERGVKLSGGQRQRVAIARAMIKDAPILVLDEATSALDSESEVLIQDALWKLMEGRTAIVIAHRLSTIQKMDRIIVMDNGKIAEEGTHQQLIKQNGIYASLWKHQSGGFLEE